MGLLYRCNHEFCKSREFIIDDGRDFEEVTGEEPLVPKRFKPYCPYCGKRDKVEFVREA